MRKSNLPRSVLDGLMQQFELTKHVTGSERQSVYAVAQRMLRVVSKSAVKLDNGYHVCELCGQTTSKRKPEDVDHNEDCPLSWIDPIKL